MNINVEKLRKDLIDYFGTAMSFMPIAMMELSEVQKANENELIKIAKDNGFDLSKYEEYWR